MGDEQSFADPTVNALCERVADLLGHEAAVFLPSGTMCNAIAFRLHIRPGGDEVVLHRTSHPLIAEAGGPAAISGAVLCPVDGDGGRFDADTLARHAAHARRPLRAAVAAGVDRADHQHRGRAGVAARADAVGARRRARGGDARAPRRRAADERRRGLRRAGARLGEPVRHRVAGLHEGARRAGRRRAGRLARADRRGVALQADVGRGDAPGGDRGGGRPVRARPPRRAAGRGPRERARARRRAGRARRATSTRRRSRPTSSCSTSPTPRRSARRSSAPAC